MKDKIIELLNKESIKLDELIEILGDEAKDTIEALIENKEIKYNKNTGKLSIYTGRMYITKEEIYNKVKENYFLREYEFYSLYKKCIKEARSCVNELIYEDKLIYDEFFEVYAIPFISKVNIKETGTGFAHNDELNQDVYINSAETTDIYNGDACKLIIIDDSGKNKEAVVIDVIERAITRVVGKLTMKNKKGKSKLILKPTMNDFKDLVEVDFNIKTLEYVGSIVVADIKYTKYGIKGTIVDRLGHPDDPGIEISEIAAEYGFKNVFPDEVIEELKSIPDYVLPHELEGRRDFRGLNVITIDGDDSKDFDDAVYLEKLDNGNYSLYVFIADVAEYVKEFTPLDNEALERGTSVYLADRVIPMLPRKLSNGICSLNEGVDRLVLACIMEIDPKGKLINYDICEGVINSHHRMTYNKVNKILDGDSELISEYSDIVDMLNDMLELSKIIRGLRYKKGGIEFETVEYKFILNKDGSPKDVVRRDRADSEKIIEDFMLSANETVAYHMNICNLPIVYRVHEKPDQEKLHQTFNAISLMNVSVKKLKNDIHPKQIQELLNNAKDNPNAAIINTMLLRSMMKAKYHEDCQGHYGLAMNYYCHFTSPIRRYPDLMTHRMIKKLLIHPSDLDNDILKYNALIPDIANRNSISERKAVDCERAVNDMLYAWLMSRYIDQSFVGTITSITSFGMFVELENGTEGLVAYRNMNGFFEPNENFTLTSNGNKVYKLGDKVEVVVEYANKETRKIDFSIKN